MQVFFTIIHLKVINASNSVIQYITTSQVCYTPLNVKVGKQNRDGVLFCHLLAVFVSFHIILSWQTVNFASKRDQPEECQKQQWIIFCSG